MQKKESKAVYTGTFDPFTNGHADIVRRALLLFDQVILLIAVHHTKIPFIPLKDRVDMLRRIYSQNKRVKVDSWEGLSVEYTKKNNIKAIIRGLRPTGDFESEYQMASMNNKIYPGCETVFLMTSGDYNFISSSLVKEVFCFGGDVSAFVPSIVLEQMIGKKSKTKNKKNNLN